MQTPLQQLRAIIEKWPHSNQRGSVLGSIDEMLPIEQRFAKDCWDRSIKNGNETEYFRDFTAFIQQFNGEKK